MDVGNIIAIVLMLVSAAVAYRTFGENKVATELRLSVVERTTRDITETLKGINDNSIRLANRLDNAEKFGTENRERIRSLETPHK